MPFPRRPSGFTLLEVLVAMVILAISLTSIMALFGQGVRMTKIAEDYSMASLLAKSKMDEVLMTKELEETSDGGSFDEFGGRFEYQIEITEYEIDYLKEEDGLDFDATRTEAPGVEEDDYIVFKVDVTVVWGDRGQKTLKLTSLRSDYKMPGELGP